MTEKKSTLNIEELKAKYGKVYELVASIEEDDDKSVDKAYLFRKPTAASFDRFVKTAANSSTKASRTFILDNIVEEQRAVLEADLEEYPAMAPALNDKLFALLGLSKDITIKKL